MPSALVRLCFVAGVLSAAATARAGVPVPCDGGTLELRAGSTLDLGWRGPGHDGELVTGAGTGFLVVKKCAVSGSPCASDDDCPGDVCTPTCDCAADPICEIVGPVSERHCLTTLEVCSSDEDCPPEIPCVSHLGPPLPLSWTGVPVCVLKQFSGPLTGTVNTATGDLSLSASMRWRIFLGIAVDMPCPRCGAPEDSPQIGDTFECEGGQRPGEECRVDGVTERFGGVSFDCAPTLASGISGPGLAINLRDLTTGTTSNTAQLPCKFFGFTANPLNPGSNPKCTDRTGPDDPVCTSNADCRRCTADTSIACSNNGDCGDSGNCAEAPDQPITCGFWCHCGFCDNDTSVPCFGDSDCPGDGSCEAGTGTGTQPNAPQQRPNDCVDDHFICGGLATEKCNTTKSGLCSEAPALPCENDEQCAAIGAGTCEAGPRPCFESRISRSGTASPLGRYCAFENKTCETNADCNGQDFCVDDAARPVIAGSICAPATASSAVNSSVGLTGPAAIEWQTLLQVCRCGNLQPGCEAVCDPEHSCGDGILGPLEDCDGGPCCESNCTLSPSTTACRPAAGACDVEETCTGSQAACPVDAVATDGTACDDETACTSDDSCTGGTCGGVSGCGDETVDEDCGETCDDGNTTGGDGCSGTCQQETLCGDANKDGQILATDAQLILQAAVGIEVGCTLAVCDVDGSGEIRTNDALATLRKAVELPGELHCQAGS